MSKHSSSGLDLAGRFARHPYQALLIAAGVGYVLAGGLFTRFTFNVLRVGIRMGALPVVQRKLLGAALTTPETETASADRDDQSFHHSRSNHERRIS